MPTPHENVLRRLVISLRAEKVQDKDEIARLKAENDELKRQLNPTKKKPTTFLTLPHELRQKILLEAFRAHFWTEHCYPY